MPLLAAILALLALFLLLLLSIPFSLVQRFRRGTSRRRARKWVASVNLVSIAISIAMFLTSAAIIGISAPRAFSYSLIGLAVGGLLGLLGLALTRWEATAETVYYTPNRVLILTISIVVATRITYGLYRGWHAWGAGGGESWLAAAGVSTSLAFGAVVLGYYFTYWAGVRGRLIRDRGELST